MHRCVWSINLRKLIFWNTIIMIQVSDKRWYWLKVFALATIRDWDALEKFSKERRPPIGQCRVSLILKLCYVALSCIALCPCLFVLLHSKLLLPVLFYYTLLSSKLTFNNYLVWSCRITLITQFKVSFDSVPLSKNPFTFYSTISICRLSSICRSLCWRGWEGWSS